MQGSPHTPGRYVDAREVGNLFRLVHGTLAVSAAGSSAKVSRSGAGQSFGLRAWTVVPMALDA